MDMGFRGLLQLGCKELWYELITWIISNYDIGYRHLCMQSNVAIPITPQDVREVLGIPDNGMGILVYNRRDTPNHTYNIHILEDNMCNLPVGEEFKKYFLIFAYATILAPNSKQEAMHDLWDTTWDKDVGVRKNWSKFVLQYVEDGIMDYCNSYPTYIRGCVLFFRYCVITLCTLMSYASFILICYVVDLQKASLNHLYLLPTTQLFYMTKFYMTFVQVEVLTPLCVAWTDDQIKRRLATEI